VLVDTAAMRLITTPEALRRHLVTTNLFGDILSDERSGARGRPGPGPSGNIGRDAAIFEPVHGSAPDIAGPGIANPTATFLAVAMLLDYLGENQIANSVRQAVEGTLRDGIHTPDLGGRATTLAVIESVVERLARS
jgi:isocitrate/isopropylmalate dehydrogenase